ncbi:hypothetical protein LCGC14_0760690 [marine sediment metagenome]|uniref:Uncharacterized protein n=1 Tax=marine sediment metagenome TaxID=412755 RepID=A0A0F9Q5C8_9ZZZZ|nr:hypothetical protein [Methylophaga sp.]HEC58064.1 hypothetical protein [Methylophaga sp.]
MSGRKLFFDAEKLILKTLEETYPRKITLDDADIGFFNNNDLNEQTFDLREILNDAFSHLKEKGLIEYTSKDDSRPRCEIKLTPSGISRIKNPIEVYKSDGIKSAISALFNALARFVENKLTS